MRRKDMVERMTQVASRAGEPILKQPLLELCGEHRALIEHHKGIGEYSTEAVSVNVRFGNIRIGGTNLEICKMTADQLVITGNIDTVTLKREVGC
jgi:sporulation protein YqfC